MYTNSRQPVVSGSPFSGYFTIFKYRESLVLVIIFENFVTFFFNQAENVTLFPITAVYCICNR